MSNLGLTPEEILELAAEAINVSGKVSAESASKVAADAPVPVPNVRVGNAGLASGRVGLVNCGNSCYMNAVLQMLYHIPEFKEGIFELERTRGAEFPLLGEPSMTLYNIFHGMDSTPPEGATNKRVFYPGELFNLDFECIYELSPGNIYVPNINSKGALVNKKFREEGIKKGMFQAENLAPFNNDSYFRSKQSRKRFLAAKLEANQKAVRGNTPANIEAQQKALETIKNTAEAELEEEVSTYENKLSSRRQLDASEYLAQCLFDKLDTVHTRRLLTYFISLHNDKIVGFYNPEDIPEAIRSTNITLTNENSVRVFLKDGGIKDGKVVKIFTSVRNEKLPILPIALEGINSVQESINSLFSKEDMAVYTTVLGKRVRGYVGLDIPKNLSKKRDITEYFNTSKRIIPERIEKETLMTIPPEQKYLIASLKRFARDDYGRTSKITRPIRINKEIIVQNSTLAEDNTIVSSNIVMELEGIICHTGSLGGGHYFYYWKEPSGTWIELNDSNVSALRTIADPKYLRIETRDYDRIVEKIAYMLLYKKKDGPPAPIPADYVEYTIPVKPPIAASSYWSSLYGKPGKTNLTNMNAALEESRRFFEEEQARARAEKGKETEKKTTTPPVLNNNALLAAALEESRRLEEERQAKGEPVKEKGNGNTFITNQRAINMAAEESKKAYIEELIKNEDEEYKDLVKEALKEGLAIDEIIKLLESLRTKPSTEKPKVNTPVPSNNTGVGDIYIEEYIKNPEIAEEILNLDYATLFEIAKKLNPSSGIPRLSPLRTAILQRLRESDKTTGTSYIYELTNIWTHGKAYFLPKFGTKPVKNYSEEAYQANKARYNKTREAKGGRKPLRRKTRKLKKSKV